MKIVLALAGVFLVATAAEAQFTPGFPGCHVCKG
jgi:hypothetical protein